MTGARLAVVDVETSGLRPGRHRILQVAVVTIDGHGTMLSEWSSLVRPRWGRFSRLGPTHIHGLRHADVRHAPTSAQVAVELARQLDGAIVVAHNLTFDWPFLERFVRSVRPRPQPAGSLCTLELSRSLDVERARSHALAALCQHYGIDPGRAHDALHDARATARLVPKLLAEAGVQHADELAVPLSSFGTA